MTSSPQLFAREMFRRRHGAEIEPSYQRWKSITGKDGRLLAVLGYRGAAESALFLEHYIEQPIEEALSARFGQPIERDAVVEIGCLAAINGAALNQLWRCTAAALAGDYRVVVATLTEPVRARFEKLGLPIVELCHARPERVADLREHWGRYYDRRPTVCAGVIADGARVLGGLAAVGAEK